MATHSRILAWKTPWKKKKKKELDMTERLHFTSLHFLIHTKAPDYLASDLPTLLPSCSA